MNVVKMKFARFPVLPILISSLNANLRRGVMQFLCKIELILLLLSSVVLPCRYQTGNKIFHENLRFVCFGILEVNQFILQHITS